MTDIEKELVLELENIIYKWYTDEKIISQISNNEMGDILLLNKSETLEDKLKCYQILKK